MKICIIAEGCYPYVVGGVSGWINNLICSFPRVSFSVLAIISDRSIHPVKRSAGFFTSIGSAQLG